MSSHHASEMYPLQGRTSTVDFTANDLGRVRRLIERAAVAAGLGQPSTDDLVVATNEIVSNAVMHAGGGGRLTVESSPDGVRVEVRDSGPGVPEGLSAERPDPRAVGGRGLWLARTLCDHLTITNGSAGATVRLFIPVV